MFLKYNKWALLWALFIFILCAIPGKDIPEVSLLGADKLIHAFVFFIEAILLMWGFKSQTKYDILKRMPAVITLIVCVVYGGLLEIMQGNFYTDRTADVYDFIANSFGATGGVIYSRWKL